MFDLVDSFIATRLSLSGVQVPVDGVELLLDDVEVDVVAPPVEVDVVFDADVAPVCVDVAVAAPFALADPEFPFGVVDDASFGVAPFDVDVLAVAPEAFAFVVFTDAPVDALVVVVLGP
jgi:hypothetical protein